jgi:hypothetical protein
MTRGTYMGAQEAQALIGKWYQVVGGGPWQQLVGADVQRRMVHQQQRDGWGGYRNGGGQQQMPQQYGGGGGYGQMPQPQQQYGGGGQGTWMPGHWERQRAMQQGAPYYPPQQPNYAPTHHRHYTPTHHRHHPGHFWDHRRTWMGADPSGGGTSPSTIPPRNALIDAPGPERAGREILPMSTGVAILPTQSAQITARPQRVAFRPERVFISAAGTDGGAADWIVNDLKIGNRSQFSQSGDVPGDMFATNAIDGFVSFETAQTAMDVVMVVTYIGTNESGVAFYGSIIGTAAI